MKFSFSGDIEGLEKGIGLFAERYSFSRSADGMPVRVQMDDKKLIITAQDGSVEIRAPGKPAFFRGLGLLLEEMRKGALPKKINIEECPQFERTGVLLDLSNNAAMRVETIKSLIEYMAAMGFTTLYLYMKDLYEVPEYPYLGYMRGRYSHDELKECDDHAALFGIEIVPCIQALSHLDLVLRWPFASALQDDPDTLLVGEDNTYEFIRNCIRAVSAPFRSRRIHLGMDEAPGLGLWRYRQRHGDRDKTTIFCEHLQRVREICVEMKLKPMIWSDMFIKFASPTHDYYDRSVKITANVSKQVPKEFALVYWDYYHTSKEEYLCYLDQHRSFNNDLIFAGGIWTWSGPGISYGQTFQATNAALAACKERGISEVIATMWGDNGSECSLLAGLLGMQLYAEHAYQSTICEETLSQRFAFCTGENYYAFLDLTRLNDISQSRKESDDSNPAKYLLWQDPLIGLFDIHAEGRALNSYYLSLVEKFDQYAKESRNFAMIFEMSRDLAAVLSDKSELGLNISKAYRNNDKDTLRIICAETLPLLLNQVQTLRKSHGKLWLSTCKAFGWEVIDIRYGGLLARLDSAASRLRDYLDGLIDHIEELEAERLFMDGPKRANPQKIGHFNKYHKIVTASFFSGNYFQR